VQTSPRQPVYSSTSVVAVSVAANRVNRIVVRHGTVSVSTALGEEDALAVAGAESRVAGVALATLAKGIAAIAITISPAFGARARFVVWTVRAGHAEWPARRTVEVGSAALASLVYAAGTTAVASAIGVDATSADTAQGSDVDADTRGAVIIDPTQLSRNALLGTGTTTVDVGLTKVRLAIMAVLDTLPVTATRAETTTVVAALSQLISVTLFLLVFVPFPGLDRRRTAEKTSDGKGNAACDPAARGTGGECGHDPVKLAPVHDRCLPARSGRSATLGQPATH
jgi:hypothetical protein